MLDAAAEVGGGCEFPLLGDVKCSSRESRHVAIQMSRRYSSLSALSIVAKLQQLAVELAPTKLTERPMQFTNSHVRLARQLPW